MSIQSHESDIQLLFYRETTMQDTTDSSNNLCINVEGEITQIQYV